ncbi:MAG: hypothetical protein F6K19_34865 [Cyanothece sp. SIO1E1]|nr:hypothetical protein [Cyanothece sp. SIO1E1]
MQTKTPTERLQVLLPDVFAPKSKTGQLYLRFRLATSLNAAISLERVVETLRIPAQGITPMPNMSPCNLGLMNNQGKIFWAIDLANLLGVSQADSRPRQYEIIVIEMLSAARQESEQLLLGLSVQQIQSTLRLTPAQVQASTHDVMPELLPYLQGQFQQQGEETWLLNVEAISNAQGLYDY